MEFQEKQYREGVGDQMFPKSWHCQNWVDPPPPPLMAMPGFGEHLITHSIPYYAFIWWKFIVKCAIALYGIALCGES